MGSGRLRVKRGGSGAKAPPLAARPDNDKSRISEGLPSSRRRRKGEGRGEGGEWREKWSASRVNVIFFFNLRVFIKE